MSITADIFKQRTLIKNGVPLSPVYRPRTVVAREPEEDDLARSVRPLKDNQLANHILITGKSGTGKTLLTRYVLDYLEHHYGAPYVYLVGENTPTHIMRAIAEALDCPLPAGITPYAVLFRHVDDCLRARNRRVIIVLDEIEHILDKAGKKLLYFLMRSEYMTLIAITNNQRQLLALDDPKIQSSYIPHVIHFAPYSAAQLREILEQRAKEAFTPGVLDDEVIPLIAALVAQDTGDARHALLYLIIAARLAEDDATDVITEEHVRKASELVSREYFLAPLSKLAKPEQLLYYTILKALKDKATISRGEVYAAYNELMYSYSGKRYTQRWMSDHIRPLEAQGLITTFQQWRQGVEWIITTPEEIDKHAMLERIEEILRGE